MTQHYLSGFETTCDTCGQHIDVGDEIFVTGPTTECLDCHQDGHNQGRIIT